MLIFCNLGLNDACQACLRVLSCVSKCYTPELDVNSPSSCYSSATGTVPCIFLENVSFRGLVFFFLAV